MNEASFLISIEESVKILKDHNLFKRKGVKAIGDHSDEFKKISRKNSYTEIYSIAIDKQDYEILLFDDSIFQFSYINGDMRFCFIQNPQIYVSKEDYLSTIYPPEELIDYSEIEIQNLLDSIKDDEFEQYSNGQNLNLESNILRYDLDSERYSPLMHSYSHLHIGLNENLRIPCSKILTPLKFVLFSIKHTYYPSWKKAFEIDAEFENKLSHSKGLCTDIGTDKWIAKEKFDLYIS